MPGTKDTNGEKYKTKDEIQCFFEKQGLVYLKRQRIEWEPLYSMKLSESPYFRINEEEFNSLSSRYAKDLAKSHVAPVYIQKVDDCIGFGVYAAADIKKDIFIGEYTGVVQISGGYDDDEEIRNGFESDFSWYYLDEIENGPELEINGRKEGNEMRFINHSSRPNIDVEHTLHDGQWVLFFKAATDIKKDEQLLISYGTEYWDDGYRNLKHLK